RSRNSTVIRPEDVRAQLRKLLASPQFANSGRLAAMLQFVVEKSLGGRAEEIKEYTLGVEVFGKPESFDPRLDTIVRVQASKLRAKLKEYYSAGGAGDAVLIDSPVAGMLPCFSCMNTYAWSQSPQPLASTAYAYGSSPRQASRWQYSAGRCSAGSASQ